MKNKNFYMRIILITVCVLFLNVIIFSGVSNAENQIANRRVYGNGNSTQNTVNAMVVYTFKIKSEFAISYSCLKVRCVRFN
ncbi:MAG: hypothetical protein M0Z72_01390 [Deltaproteobacteria bacterium]|nr:hypothetical protein [Deltaproteobacteria bacterium]